LSATTGAASSRWDRLGVLASIACTVHCIAGPFLFLAAPTFADVWSHPAAHAVIALFVLPLAATVLLRGYHAHGKTWVAVCAWTGVAFILAGCALPFVGTEVAAAEAGACATCCPQLVPSAEGDGIAGVTWPPASIATVLGSVFLVASHLGNLAYCRCCALAVRA
jgi:MerC mercury resistance protein